MLGVRDYVGQERLPHRDPGAVRRHRLALTATIAADALGPDRVYTVLMPSRYSSDHSISDAKDLVHQAGLHLDTVPIKTMVDSFEAALSPAGFPAGPGCPRRTCRPALRGIILMGL